MIIQLDTAILAAEKNYNDVINRFYHRDTKDLHGGFSDNSMMSKYRISAPYQYILQKWLRDVHGIVISVCPSTENTGFYYFIHEPAIEHKGGLVRQPIYGLHDGSISQNFEIYEDALEDALVNSLIKIKIDE